MLKIRKGDHHEESKDLGRDLYALSACGVADVRLRQDQE
jgi:hypothetical protein